MVQTKPDVATLTTGTVKFWNQERGFGFITTADYRDIFAHISQISDECDDPAKGDRVTFIEDKGRDGRPYARRIAVIKDPATPNG
jgi:CspA family cold shock protein